MNHYIGLRPGRFTPCLFGVTEFFIVLFKFQSFSSKEKKMPLVKIEKREVSRALVQVG